MKAVVPIPGAVWSGRTPQFPLAAALDRIMETAGEDALG